MILIIPIVFADIAAFFSYSDAPFILGFLIALKTIGRKTAFVFSFFLLLWMGFSYIPTGASAVTERIGEWFYLFFVYGLIQYAYEMYRLRK